MPLVACSSLIHVGLCRRSISRSIDLVRVRVTVRVRVGVRVRV